MPAESSGPRTSTSEIRSFYAAQIRVRRAPRAGEGSARYWLAGLQYFNITKLDGRGTLIRHKPSGALSAGHGWGHAFQNGARILSEIGFAGGDGFMVVLPRRRAVGTAAARSRSHSAA